MAGVVTLFAVERVSWRVLVGVYQPTDSLVELEGILPTKETFKLACLLCSSMFCFFLYFSNSFMDSFVSFNSNSFHLIPVIPGMVLLQTSLHSQYSSCARLIVQLVSVTDTSLSFFPATLLEHSLTSEDRSLDLQQETMLPHLWLLWLIARPGCV